MNKTANYNLNQWEPSDKVQRTDFNADNAKLDAALKAQADALAGKASAAAVSSLQSSISSVSAALSGKGNCQIYTTSYNGKGQYGASYPTTLSFSKRPLAVFIAGPQSDCLFMFQGVAQAKSGAFGGGSTVNITWSGNSVTWYNNVSADSQMDQLRNTYQVIALLAA